MYGYVIFTDIEKYSTLKDADLKIYYNKVVPLISEKLKVYKDAAIIWNTWGDAIVAVYEKAEMAIQMSLAYRDVFKELNFAEFGIRKLNPRIAGNFGEFELVFDPVSGKENVHGTLVNLTARIEPVTLPGEIFVTKEFRDMSRSSYDKVGNVRFDDMGEIKLPKNAGVMQLYRLCKSADKRINPVGTVLFPELNYIPSMDTDDEDFAEFLNKKAQDEKEKADEIPKIVLRSKSVAMPAAKSMDLLKQKIHSKDNDSSQDSAVAEKPVTYNNVSYDNPFVAGIAIFILALIINFVLDSVFASLKISFNFLNPGFVAVLASLSWTKGYILAAFMGGTSITVLEAKMPSLDKIFIICVIAAVFKLGLLVQSDGKFPELRLVISAVFSVCLAITACYIGLEAGIAYAVKLFKLKKITFKVKNGPLKYL